MKKLLVLLSLLSLSVVTENTSTDAAYYDVTETTGANGPEYIINRFDNVIPPAYEKINSDNTQSDYTGTRAKQPEEVSPLIECIKKTPSSPAQNSNLTQQKSDKAINTDSSANQTLTVTKKTSTANTKSDLAHGHVSKTQEPTEYYTNWSDEEALIRVKTIGKGLLKANNIKQNVNFVITNDKSVVNATTDIEGTVNIYTGIIQYCESEDELAFVIGHEIGHATSYHVAKKVVTNTAASVANDQAKHIALSKIGGALGGNPFNNLAQSSASVAIDATTVAGTSKISRVQEENADFLACDYLVKKGYNPAASISILYKIGENYPDLFVDHPSTDKRIKEIYNYLNEKYPQALSKGCNTDAYAKAISTIK